MIEKPLCRYERVTDRTRQIKIEREEYFIAFTTINKLREQLNIEQFTAMWKASGHKKIYVKDVIQKNKEMMNNILQNWFDDEMSAFVLSIYCK